MGGQAAVYAVGSPLPAQCRPPSTVQSYVCGIGPYSFAPMATGPDLVGSFSGSTLFVRLCGAVSQGNCVSQFGSSVMACQIGQSSLSLGFNFAYAQQLTYSPSGPALTFSYINGVDGSAGIAFTGADGELCNGAPRQFLGSLTCGATAQILNYTESPTCAYHYIISTPLACPPATNLAFCQISSTAPVASYNTWLTAITGVINGTFAPPSQQANYGQSGVTYIAQNFVGSASISFSTLYASTNSTSLVAAAGLNYTGATALSVPISIAPVGSFEGNDNVVYYVSNSSTGWVTSGGFSFNYQSGNSSQVFYDPASGNLMAYYDSFLGYALYYSFLQIAPLGSSTTLPAGWCSLPTLSSTATAGASVSFGFCYLTYVTNVFSAYTTSFYWASSATGVITATSTANTGQYLVTGISGTRTLSTSFGFQASAAGSASLSLGSGSGNSPSTPQYVYVNSPLNFNSSSTDGVTGLTFALSSNQTDASGCTGSAVTSYGTVVVCNGNEGSSATSYLTSLTLVSGSTAPPCSPRAADASALRVRHRRLRLHLAVHGRGPELLSERLHHLLPHVRRRVAVVLRVHLRQQRHGLPVHLAHRSVRAGGSAVALRRAAVQLRQRRQLQCRRPHGPQGRPDLQLRHAVPAHAVRHAAVRRHLVQQLAGLLRGVGHHGRPHLLVRAAPPPQPSPTAALPAADWLPCVAVPVSAAGTTSPC